MNKKRFISILIWIAAVAALLIGLVFLTGFILVKRSAPDFNGVLHNSAVTDSVEITVDAMGIPQIWAQNEEDASYAMGYLHAADRLFQMDLTRRAAHGRLSELFGASTLEIDRQQRLIGHTRIARQFISRLSEDNKRRLEAYARGVNTYIESCAALPFEYYLLRKKAEQWHVLDCLAIFSFQTWFSNALMNRDEFYLRLAEKIGAESAAALFEDYPSFAPVTVPPLVNRSLSGLSFAEVLAGQLFQNDLLPFQMAHSSNSWVVAPRRSASGSAMLASDPHLEISRLPQFWYYLGVHVAQNGNHALGVTAPGLPFITMGHNGRCAWAFTVGGIDVIDYYAEKTDPADSSRYLTPDGTAKFTIIHDSIWVAGKDQSLGFDIKISRHGPLLIDNDSLQQAYALHWSGYDADLDRAVAASFNLKEIAGFDDFRRTVTQLGALDANWTYADLQGNIGYQLGSPLPIRPDFKGAFALPGWQTGFEWQGYQPLENTPHSLNPARGWLATCNNKQQEDSPQLKLTGTFASDRILRISNLLETQPVFSAKDLQRFQMDRTDDYLLRWKEPLAALLDSLHETNAAQQLRSWNGSAEASSPEAALVMHILNRAKHRIFNDELGRLAGRISPRLLESVWNIPAAVWWDDIKTADHKESRSEILGESARQALQHWGGRQWGAFHTLVMQHPLAIVPGISALLGLKTEIAPWGGAPGTLNASFFYEDKKSPGHYNSLVGPSWRFVIDFAQVDSATIVLPAGNSGNPMSAHFMDFYEMWRDGRRWNVPLSRAEVEKRTARRLILTRPIER